MSKSVQLPPIVAEGDPPGTPLSRLRSNRSPQTFYHPELDVLRFCAFMLVFLAHSSTEAPGFRLFPPGLWAVAASALGGAGFSGLALFFTLSSYLITALLLQEHDRNGGIHLRAFYTRRILRIWPLYFFFLLLIRPLAQHYLPYEHFTVTDYLTFLLLLGNWLCYYKGFPPSVATPLWSISVEEQFYLVWPILLSRLRRHVSVIAVGMLVLANISRALLVLYPKPDPALWCSTFTRLDPFALGALLAVYTHGHEVRMSRPLRGMLMCIAVLLSLFLGRSGAHNGDMALLFYPMEGIACCLALFATLLPMGAWQPGIVGSVLVYLGRISYGLYVYHLMALTLANRVTSMTYPEHEAMALIGTVVVAAISYAAIEKPFLRLKQRFTYVRSRM